MFQYKPEYRFYFTIGLVDDARSVFYDSRSFKKFFLSSEEALSYAKAYSQARSCLFVKPVCVRIYNIFISSSRCTRKFILT